jgi:hypothetical protein
MFCPNCGAKLEDGAAVCSYCKEELKKTEELNAEEIAEEVKAEAAEEAAAEEASETAEGTEPAAEQTDKPEKAKKEKKEKKKLNLKNPKNMITVIAAVVAVVIFVAAIFGIASLAKKVRGPEKTAEEYVEAMTDGNIRKALRNTAPWVLRNMAEMLDLNENASVGRIANEYEEQMGDFGLGGKITIEDVRLTGYTDANMGEVLSELDIFDDYSITYKEVKSISEIAIIEVEASLKVLGEKEYATFGVYCARLDGEWTVIDFDSNY